MGSIPTGPTKLYSLVAVSVASAVECIGLTPMLTPTGVGGGCTTVAIMETEESGFIPARITRTRKKPKNGSGRGMIRRIIDPSTFSKMFNLPENRINDTILYDRVVTLSTSLDDY